MRAYVLTTGVIFGLLVVAHTWRMFAESASLAADPFYILITLASAMLSIWGCTALVAVATSPSGSGSMR